MPLAELLPEDLKGEQLLTNFKEVPDLARAYVEGQKADWKTKLPEDIRTEKSFESVKDVGQLGKLYLDAHKYSVGAIKIPGENAKPEEWDAFYAKLGRPGKPEEYGLSKPENLPAGVSWDDGMAKWFANTAHKLGMPKGMAQKFLPEYAAYISQQTEAVDRKGQEMVASVRQEWGHAFPAKVKVAADGINYLGGKDLMELNEAQVILPDGSKVKLGDHPAMLKSMYRMGKLLAEHGFVAGEIAPGGKTVQQQIDEINANKDHPYWDETKPGHKEAVAHMTQLFRQKGA